MAKISDIISLIEESAPLRLQEDFDNAGLQLGDASMEATSALLCIDVTEAVLDEAISIGANLVISHHPLIFRGIKKLTGKNEIERIVIKAVRNGIAIYSAHTNIDSARYGVSYRMAQKLGVTNVKPLVPQKGKLVKIVAFVPRDYADIVSSAMCAKGAGNIGDYDNCSYRMLGDGSFRAKEGANPFVGNIDEVHHEPEVRVEVIAALADKDAVVNAMLNVHPYEEPAYDVIPLLNDSPYEGLGVVGEITPVPYSDFLSKLKHTFDVAAVRYCGDETRMVKHVALCGGNGAEFIGDAVRAGADVYVTGDVKYHDFTGNSENIMIADIGHYESEQFTKDIFYELIRKKMPNFATYYAKSEIKQVKFYI